jgi:general secretion pathway protein M
MPEATGKQTPRCGMVLGSMAVLLLLAVASMAIPWWSKWQAYQEDAADTAARVARYRALIESREDIEKQLHQLQEQIRQRGYFVEAGNPDLAAADLQQRIKEIVTKAAGTLVSTQSLAGNDRETSRTVVIKVRMKGDMDALARVLYALETGVPVVTVENLSIRGRRTVKGRRKNRVEGYSMDVNFNVLAYMMEASP